MKRPIFSENQFSSSNPHQNLTPRMSKIIIAAHAKDGVEMAQKYKLPEILQDIMLEHHGTSLVSFFMMLQNNNKKRNCRWKTIFATLAQSLKRRSQVLLCWQIQQRRQFDQLINQH